MGDFNSIRNSSERFGACHRGLVDAGSREFNEWIEEMEVEEAPWVGSKFTWVRPNGTARSKLDRVLLSPEWMSKWPGTTQYTLERNFSDHYPILLRSKNVDWGPKPFRIMDCWLSDISFKKTVEESWKSNQQKGWGGYVLKEKIKALKNRLKVWNREQFGDTFKKYTKIQEELNKMEADTADRQLSQQEMMIRKQLQEDLWMAAQSHESLLRQKARSRWIKEGDCNSRYFHLMINATRRNNCLKGLMVDGAWTDDPTTVKEAVRVFFEQHFKENEKDRPTLDGVAFKTIDNQQNQTLVSCFQEEEIRRAVWDCGSEKSPGPDGLTFKFIRQFWNIIKPNVMRFLDEFYVNGIFPKGSNASFLALIPKVADPQLLNEYKPISLIGCTYKIVAKILASRLKKAMPFIIHERQSAFIEGRYMLHSVMIANEVVDEAKRCHKSCFVFKVDYEKAYDSVSWEFLFYMLKRMGFCDKRIQWVEGCITSASISVLVNGSPSAQFVP